MNDDTLVLNTRDALGVVTLTLNRPSAFNALSEGLMEALQRELDRVAADKTVRAVVIAAAGRAFCAGHDLKEMRAAPELGYYQRLFALCGRMMMTIQQLPVPVIARVHGIATAAGCQLVAMCDLAVAAREARFAVSGINAGLFCSTPSVALSRNVPRKLAFRCWSPATHRRRGGACARPGEPSGRCRPARRRGRGTGREHRRQAGRVDRPRQGAVLPATGAGHPSGLRTGGGDHGLQHDGRAGAGRRTGLHREAAAPLGRSLTSARRQTLASHARCPRKADARCSRVRAFSVAHGPENAGDASAAAADAARRPARTPIERQQRAERAAGIRLTDSRSAIGSRQLAALMPRFLIRSPQRWYSAAISASNATPSSAMISASMASAWRASRAWPRSA